MKHHTAIELIRQATNVSHRNNNVSPEVCVVVDVDLKEGEISGIADIRYSAIEKCIVITTKEREVDNGQLRK